MVTKAHRKHSVQKASPFGQGDKFHITSLYQGHM